jgi:hypothetical protein
MSSSADSTTTLPSIDRQLSDARNFFEFDEPSTATAGDASSSNMPPAVPQPSPVADTPLLPHVPAAVPLPPSAPTMPAANLFMTAMNPPPGFANHAAPLKKSRFKRFVGIVLMLGLVGGAVAGGMVYGSDLMELAKGEAGQSEPAAPLSFPIATMPLPQMRTASFVVENDGAAPGARLYDVTIDFDTGVAQVIIDRGDEPALEVLTIFDDAIIRRVDEPTWYRLDRGVFPVDTDQGRERWVRTLDELIPAAMRSATTITDSTESVLDNETMRRLVVSIDPTALTRTPPPVAAGAPPAADVAPVEAAPAEPIPGEAPIAPAPPVDVPAVELPPEAVPAWLTLASGADPTTPVSLQMWIDRSGVVRKIVSPPELGGETIFVVWTSPEPWLPAFPGAELVQPLTASALFSLGL